MLSRLGNSIDFSHKLIKKILFVFAAKKNDPDCGQETLRVNHSTGGGRYCHCYAFILAEVLKKKR